MTHKELLVWQKGITLATELHRLTRSFPSDEVYGLTSQMRRAVVSIPSNIAEGYGRGSSKELIRFLKIALGSASELETQVILAHKFEYLSDEQAKHLLDKIVEITRMLSALIKTINVEN